MRPGWQRKWQRFGRCVKVEHVAAKAVEVLVQVRARAGEGCGGDRGTVPVHGEAVERACHANDGVKDEQVGDEVVVLDHLALLVALGSRGQAAAAE